MRPGKLTASELESLIFPRCGVRRADVLVPAGIGHDASVVAFGEEVAVLSVDPITGAGQNAGWLAVQIGVNDVAAAGAAPVGVLLALLLAPISAARDVRILMEGADRAARSLGIAILGGHSEITADLPRSLIVVTALGRAPRGRFVSASGAQPGDTILLTKAAGLEGTAVLASDFAAALQERVSPGLLDRARALLDQISVVPEALAAVAAGVTAMHDCTEGGILGALAELARASGHGVEVDGEQIPVRPETRAICDALEIDPLALISSGALLVTTPEPERVLEAVRQLGCPATAIGRVVAGPSRIRRGDRVSELVAPDRDALWDALDQLRGASGE